jgi:excisionase family DNA binding protein
MTNALLTTDEAARFLGLSPFTVRRLLREGELPGSKVGKRRWRIRRADLEEYLGASNSGNSGSPHQQLQRTWQGRADPKRLEELAAEQGVKPVNSSGWLRLTAWLQDGEPDEDEWSVEDFLAPIYELRESSRAEGKV